ncbi:hypothetical protein WJX82_003654 [Trebouxia sp. C0006]
MTTCKGSTYRPCQVTEIAARRVDQQKVRSLPTRPSATAAQIRCCHRSLAPVAERAAVPRAHLAYLRDTFTQDCTRGQMFYWMCCHLPATGSRVQQPPLREHKPELSQLGGKWFASAVTVHLSLAVEIIL